MKSFPAPGPSPEQLDVLRVLPLAELCAALARDPHASAEWGWRYAAARHLDHALGGMVGPAEAMRRNLIDMVQSGIPEGEPRHVPDFVKDLPLGVPDSFPD